MFGLWDCFHYVENLKVKGQDIACIKCLIYFEYLNLHELFWVGQKKCAGRNTLITQRAFSQYQ